MALSEQEELELLELERAKAMSEASASEKPVPGKMESFARGAAQGASLGFADETTGGLAAIKDYLSRKKPDESFVDSYRRNRDESRENYGRAAEANPVTYGAGEFSGAAGTLLIPGMGEANAARLAALGGLAGIGSSNADITKGEIGEAAKDTAIGAGIGAASNVVANKVIMPVARKAAGMAGKGAKRALSYVFGPSVESIEARLANPEAIKNAPSFAEIAEKVPDTLGTLSGKISELDGKAWETLSKSKRIEDGAVQKETVSDLMDYVKKKLGNVTNHDIGRALRPGGEDSNIIVGRSDELAVKTLENLKQNIAELPGGTISEAEIKAIIQKLDDNINWEDPTAKQTNAALKSVRHFLDDMLKEQNNGYREAMRPVDEHVNLLGKSENFFKPKRVAGKGYEITDTTTNKIKHVLNEEKNVSQDVLRKLKDVTGDDYLSQTKNAAISEAFERPRTNGSRNTNRMAITGGGIGGAVGAAVGGWPGATIGSGVGSVVGANVGAEIDKHGGAYAAKIIDYYTKHPEAFGKFAGVLRESLKRGPQAFAVTHFILGQQNPEYQETYRKIQEGIPNE